MKLGVRFALLTINLLVVILIGIIILTDVAVLRIILGLPFIIFSPGYVLIAALFPRKDSLGGVDRIALSFGVSLAVVALIGFILNYTPWGIGLESFLYFVAVFIFLVSGFAWFRNRKLSEAERPSIEFRVRVPRLPSGGWGKILAILLVISMLGVFATLGYVIAGPESGERFTEFYITGLSGEATDYPKEIAVGEKGEVIVGIINQERESLNYRVEVVIEGDRNNELGTGTLEYRQKWEGIVSFKPERVGDNQKIEFLLYRQGQDEVYRRLYLWMDVME